MATEKLIFALRVTPGNLRLALNTIPEVGEMAINEVLESYVVLNVPRTNKNGSLSKRPPQKFIVLDSEAFDTRFMFAAKRSQRDFVQVTIR